jgi:hypothetical protein
MNGSRHAESPGSRTSRTRAVLLVLIAILYVASVPWYRPIDAPLRIWLGLPDWVATALLCYVVAAVLNAWAWLIADVRDPGEAGVSDDAARATDVGERP